MRLGPIIPCELFGRVQICPVQRVIEIDSTSSTVRPVPVTPAGDVIISIEELAAIQQQMVIVIACMNEDDSVIEGVLSGIPGGCLVIIVSNSDRGLDDKYAAEVRVLSQFCKETQRAAMIIHQQDLEAADAFRKAGMPELVSSAGTIYPGKGEAMIIGMALAALTGRKYIGYVDADNFVPGSVNEYCKVFAAGLYAAKSPRAMVRISWNSKPKIRDGRIHFDKRGRSSRVVNEWFNKLLNEYTDHLNSELIVTGNAGEHAMTLELGLKLRLAGGYAIEPYELLNILEQYGKSSTRPGAPLSRVSTGASGFMANPSVPTMASPPSLKRSDSGIVQVLQIQTRNPHFHESKGEGHVRRMQLQGLNVLYHSPLTPKALRAELAKFMEDQDDLLNGERPPCAQIYPPVGTLDFGVFFDLLTANSTSFRQFLTASMPPQASLISRP
ncbi:putative mannosyl-3-phosphoglycerate synthase [Microdochium bolleyi]|uniref:Putative mannosyl-3-phosphoglycerate synthase n=1 Tax=Microdochium bolleyi TaxID=196109 RepID=A0A136JGQ4_9PEZI|nr:putative mannosyl-3-phosphoglycerate synthase [Microdochium bolleyi]